MKKGDKFIVKYDPKKHSPLSNAFNFNNQEVTFDSIYSNQGSDLLGNKGVATIMKKDNSHNIVFISALEPIKEKFVLPDNWYIALDIENKEIVKEWWDKKNYGPRIWNYGSFYGIVKGVQYSKYHLFLHDADTKEITFEQFKKYVLKEENTVAPQFEILSRKANGHMTSVSNNEGNVFEIGDIVKCKIIEAGNIKSFKFSNKNKTTILAITDKGKFNINNIDHDLKSLEKHLEPIDNKLDLISEAKRRYPEGCVVRSMYDGSSKLIKNHSLIITNLKGNVIAYNNAKVILRGTDGIWIEKVRDTLNLSQYEILSFKGIHDSNNGLFELRSNNLYCWSTWNDKRGISLEIMLKTDSIIYSVKQLYTNKIFSVGDKYGQDGVITKIELSENNNIVLHYTNTYSNGRTYSNSIMLKNVI